MADSLLASQAKFDDVDDDTRCVYICAYIYIYIDTYILHTIVQR
jgi:hypothetical protein